MWQNRITKYSDEAPDQLLANPRNFRMHPDSQAGALRGVLTEVGIVQNVIANERTGFLIDGHLRVMEALKSGQPTIPVTWVDVSEEEEALILATLDPIAALAGTDAAKLEALLHDVSTADAAVQQMLDTLATEAGIVPGIVPGIAEGNGGDEFDTTPEDGPTRTTVGDLWLIGGKHRLLVGDCTDATNVARLMDGERAQLTVTDPPFGVRDDEWDQFDSLENLIAFTAKWMRLCPVDVWAVFFADKYLPLLFKAADQAGAPQWRRSLIWYKPPGSQFAGASLDGFWYDFELVSVFGQPDFKPDGPPKFAVLEHRTVTNQEHGCEKPVGLLEDIINGYSQPDTLLYEPFMGTGTTLIAAQRAGRNVYGCEFVPKNADVILRRAEAEGLDCVKVE